MDSQVPSVADEPQSGTPSTVRLVIRVKINAEGTAPAPVRRRVSRGALLLILGAVAVLLSWVAIRFWSEPTSTPAAIERVPNSKPQSTAPAPAASKAAPVGRATQSAEPEPRSTAAKSVASDAREQPNASPSSINEVIPDVPRSARQTIRGTIRVSVRVTIDKEGKVLAATADEPGPSRYFEHLATEASKKWTFTTSDSAAQRIVLVRFNFTRGGTTAHAKSLQ